MNLVKQLILLRHAKSDWDSAADGDFARRLSQRGRRDAPRIGNWLRENGYTPQIIIGSPSARTTETIELVCTALPYPQDRVLYEQQLYHGTAEQICQTAVAQLERCECVLIVGHNPGMEQALWAYCPTAEPVTHGKVMPTCTAAVIELQNATDANGNLRDLMRPSDLLTSDTP